MPCGKFGDCSLSRFGSIVQTHAQTDAGERFTPATLVGVSNDYSRQNEFASEQKPFAF